MAEFENIFLAVFFGLWGLFACILGVLIYSVVRVSKDAKPKVEKPKVPQKFDRNGEAVIDYSRNFKPRIADVTEILKFIFTVRRILIDTKLSESDAINRLNDKVGKNELINQGYNHATISGGGNGEYQVSIYIPPMFKMFKFFQGPGDVEGFVENSGGSACFCGTFSVGIVTRIYMFMVICGQFIFFSVSTLFFVAYISVEAYQRHITLDSLFVFMWYIGFCFMNYLVLKIYRMNLGVLENEQNALEEYIESIFR